MKWRNEVLMFWRLVENWRRFRLSRRQRAPQGLDTANESKDFPVKVEDHYRQIYFEVLDYAISTINTSFNQSGYAMYRKVKGLLLKTLRAEDASDEFRSVTDYYGDDFAPNRLSLHLKSLAAQFNGSMELCLLDILTYVKEFSLQNV